MGGPDGDEMFACGTTSLAIISEECLAHNALVPEEKDVLLLYTSNWKHTSIWSILLFRNSNLVPSLNALPPPGLAEYGRSPHKIDWQNLCTSLHNCLKKHYMCTMALFKLF